MERIIYRKTLDLFKGGRQFVLQGVQTGDNIAREVEISLASGGDTYDLPFSNVTACAYITDAKGNVSLVDCAIRNNKVAFCVPKITEAGVAEVTIKIIETSLNGAKKTIATPKFALEVWDSGLNDEDIENTPTFSKLENALARSEEVYDKRLLDVEVDENLTFKARYADGKEYETTAIREGIGSTLLVPKGIYNSSTNYNTFELVNFKDENGNVGAYMALQPSIGKTPSNNSDYWSNIFDINEAIADAYVQLNNDTIAELVANNSTSYADDLLTTSLKPILVMWDDKTGNTPYTEGLTKMTSGYAIISGNKDNNHTITAWTEGADASGMYIATVTNGVSNGYQVVVTGERLENGVVFGNNKGDIVTDNNGTFISARSAITSDSANYLKVANPDAMADKSNAVTVTTGGKEYKLYGEHNNHFIDAFGFAKMASGYYDGKGESGSSKPTQIEITEFEPKLVYIQSENNETPDGNLGYCAMHPIIVASGNAYCDFQMGGSNNNALFRTRLNVSWNKDKKTLSISGAANPFIQMNAFNEKYHWVAIG